MAAAFAAWHEAALLALLAQPPPAAALAAPPWLLEPARCCCSELLACLWAIPAWAQDRGHSNIALRKRPRLQKLYSGIGSIMPIHLCSHATTQSTTRCTFWQTVARLSATFGGGGGSGCLGCAARPVGLATPRCCTGRALAPVGAGVLPLLRAPGLLVTATCMGAGVQPVSICVRGVGHNADNLHRHWQHNRPTHSCAHHTETGHDALHIGKQVPGCRSPWAAAAAAAVAAIAAWPWAGLLAAPW